MVGFVVVVIQSTQYVVVLWLGLPLLPSLSKHTICGRIMVGSFVLVVSQ